MRAKRAPLHFALRDCSNPNVPRRYNGSTTGRRRPAAFGRLVAGFLLLPGGAVGRPVARVGIMSNLSDLQVGYIRRLLSGVLEFVHGPAPVHKKAILAW